MPKLKVGDRFVYTQEMCDKWRNYKDGIFGIMERFIGDTQLIINIETARNEPVYRTDNVGNMPICCVDPYLPNSLTPFSMSSLLEKAAIAFKNEPEKSFRKAGITDGDDLLTEDGVKLFLSFLLRKYGAEFKKEVVDPLLVEEKK